MTTTEGIDVYKRQVDNHPGDGVVKAEAGVDVVDSGAEANHSGVEAAATREIPGLQKEH